MDRKETVIGLKDGEWRVIRRGEHLKIIDPQGRQRHVSRGHDMTGVHLAMCLAEKPFASEPNLDEALRILAKQDDLPVRKVTRAQFVEILIARGDPPEAAERSAKLAEGLGSQVLVGEEFLEIEDV